VDLPGLVTAPESTKVGTRRLVEDHLQKHGQYSLYLATVVATSAPNQSIAMEIVNKNKLEGNTIGVFTKCDHAMAIPDERELFQERLQSPPPANCGAVALAPYGWVCLMNANPTGSKEQSNFARLKQQAVDEGEFMREKMPEVVEAGDAGCEALVQRIRQQFTQFLSASWGPRTIKLLREALEQAQVENAALGLPEFHHAGADHAKRARDQAVREAERRVNQEKCALIQGCCRNVLQKLKNQLCAIAGESMANVDPSIVPSKWKLQRQKFDDACAEGVEAWGSYWLTSLRGILEAPDPKPTTPVVKEQLLASPPFVLARFPAYINALVKSVKRALAPLQDTLLQEMKELGDRYYGKMSPWVKITTNFAEGAPRMTLTCDHIALVENVMYCFVEQSTCGILDQLKSSMEQVACGIADSNWTESCAEERLRLEVRIRDITGAKEQVETLLGFEREGAAPPAGDSGSDVQAEREGAAPPAGDSGSDVRRVFARTSRVFPQYITHPTFATNGITGVALSREGHLLVADRSDSSVKVFSGNSNNGTHLRTLAKGDLFDPRGVAAGDDGKVYVADHGSQSVRVFESSGKYVKDIGGGFLQNPHDVALDAQGQVYVADGGNHVVSIFDTNGEFVRDIGVRANGGTLPGLLHRPVGVAVDKAGNVFVSNKSANTVSMFDNQGSFVRNIGQGALQQPDGVAVCPEGRIYVSSFGSNYVMVFNQTGSLVQSIPAACPTYICVDDRGQICVTELLSKRVLAQ
jgi:sugar lactone lactonase YvrE